MYGQYKICLWTIYSAFFTREQAKLKEIFYIVKHNISDISD